MYMQGQGPPGQQLPQHARQGLGTASQANSNHYIAPSQANSTHYMTPSMGASNAHMVGMGGALPSAMMVNGAVYSGAEALPGMSAAQMMPSPSVINGPVIGAPVIGAMPAAPSSQHHQQQLMVHQRSRASATPHHHARAAMAQQRQQGGYGNSAFDAAHMAGGASAANYADFLSGRSTTPLGLLNGRGATPVTIRPPSTRAKSASVSSASGRRTPRAATPAPHPNQQQPPARGSRWTELDLGGMSLRAVAPPLFRYTFMTKLYINHNQLTHIPPAIAQLRCLEELDASGNLLSAVPPELGLCCRLRELLLFDNQITDLPSELGTLFQLESLGLEGNPLQDDLKGLLQKDGARALIEYLRDNGPASAAPPDRNWISLDKDVSTDSPEIVTVLSYNVLCPKYATPQMYSYCPSWALSWEYRRDSIMSELSALQPDIVCLQEVAAGQYDEFFSVKLREMGYDGVFWTKSRARTMGEDERKSVDGCATFYKSSIFTFVDSHLLEFQQSGLNRKDFRKCDDFFNRFMTKDNIVGFAMLRHRKLPAEPMLFVANAHVHWDPEFVDVKMVQTAMLTEELALLVRKHMPEVGPEPSLLASGGNSSDSEAHRIQLQLQAQQKQFQKIAAIICGDFNSTPDSGLYEFLSRGRLDKDHEEVVRLEPYADYKRHGLRHPFGLKSSYSGHGELPLTNLTPTFRGTIDYIWYTTGTLVPTGLLGEVDEDWVSQTVGFPNAHIPSDHIPIMAEFKWRPGGGSTKPSSHHQSASGWQSFQYRK
ncbi:Glucose-repressible alcohol dehydrogenase transcriptional effector [Coemansia sp. RSA 552]|nr:Glucose-repressible alcohol dehydrogenase transcriptional effector [Coemansia sp. RSA 552]